MKLGLYFGACAVFLSHSVLAAKVDERVLRALRSNAKSVTVVVHLAGQLDLERLTKNSAGKLNGPELAKVLEKHTRSESLPLLRALSSGNHGLEEVTYLWLTNSLRLKGSPDTIRRLMSSNGVEAIDLDAPKEMFELGAATGTRATSVTDEPQVGWGVTKVRAPELWVEANGHKKVDGTGIVVAVIDSGANLTHPDLKPNLWQNPGETGLDASGQDLAKNGIDDDGNGYIDDTVGWNFEEKTNDPTDVSGHGSQTAGIVGGMGAGGTQTGVAPGAKLMILRSCCNTGTEVFETITWEAIQYAIKNGARVISMSLSVKHPSKPSYAKWRRVGEVELAAGIVHVNSAGNRGSAGKPFNIGAPASNPPAWMHPKQPFISTLTSMITIGATDETDKIRSYSSTGPVTWEAIEEYKDFPYENGAKGGLIRPDVCGPSEVPSTSYEGTGYTAGFSGTSSATPHIAGVVALLLSAEPRLTVAQVTETLQMSAVKVEDEFNNKCGAGRVDAFAAVEYARTHFH